MQLQLHYITHHYATHRYANYITLHYNWNYHYIALHDTTLKLQLHYFTLQYARLHYTIPRYSTQHYSTIHYTTLVAPHHNYNCNCNYANYTTLQLLYNTTTITTTTPLHYSYSYNYNCTTPHYIQQLWWGDQCNHFNHSRKHNLSVHQWIRSAIRESQQPTLPIGFLFLKLPSPPCAVLLVYPKSLVIACSSVAILQAKTLQALLCEQANIQQESIQANQPRTQTVCIQTTSSRLL